MRRSILIATVASMAIAAVAFAAPKPGTWLASIGTTFQASEGNAFFRVTSGGAIKHAPNAKKIFAPSDYSCNSSNLAVTKRKIRIKRGKFSYKGAAYVNYGDTQNQQYKGTLTWKGKFTTKKKVKGTIRFVSPVTPKITSKGPKFSQKECDTGTQNFVGKFSG